MHTLRVVACLALTATVVGCGGSSVDIYDYSGTVTYKGQPITYGQIEFVPDAEGGNTGPKGYAEIVDGKYDTGTAPGKGVTGGPYLALITAYEKRPEQVEDETVEVEPVTTYFIGYEMKQDLPKDDADNVDFAVPEEAEGVNRYEGEDPRRRRANEP
ncbi:hypothetical protein [Rubinisphaera margarita]|uniref:hypothetical protein n=1 Tax=Rubinisphaera margarita TaxID=2909586 RepID=UPI001EE7A883|nr:hypothetical protein [Rubinisphaera margarita]MCG6157954.1 hypothetical protein [Rubinisphaera margarita]